MANRLSRSSWASRGVEHDGLDAWVEAVEAESVAGGCRVASAVADVFDPDGRGRWTAASKGRGLAWRALSGPVPADRNGTPLPICGNAAVGRLFVRAG